MKWTESLDLQHAEEAERRPRQLKRDKYTAEGTVRGAREGGTVRGVREGGTVRGATGGGVYCQSSQRGDQAVQ